MSNWTMREAAGELMAELVYVSDWLENEADAMGCSAGNFDGGSAQTCEHCQLVRWKARIDVVLAKARGQRPKDDERTIEVRL